MAVSDTTGLLSVIVLIVFVVVFGPLIYMKLKKRKKKNVMVSPANEQQ